MTEMRYREVFELFLNDYWGAFHEALEAQSVNPRGLAPPLFDALVAAHRRFADQKGFTESSVAALARLWDVVASRRAVTADAPLTAREIAFARAHFEKIYDRLAARGTLFPRASADALAVALHGHPRSVLRADAAR
jgi:hypothetical protein